MFIKRPYISQEGWGPNLHSQRVTKWAKWARDTFGEGPLPSAPLSMINSLTQKKDRQT